MDNSKNGADKLRKACNECNSAKVRCSGERSGCHRCTAAGRECVYGQSRVGKVPGLRSRRRQHPSESNSSQHSSQQMPRGTPAPPATPPTSQDLSGSHIAFNDSIADWTTDFGPSLPSHSMAMEDVSSVFDAPFTVETPPPLSASTMTSQSLGNSASTARSSLPSSAGYEHDLMDTCPPPSVMDIHDSPRPYAPDPNPPATLARRGSVPTTSKLDSRCITICCAIIGHLEKYIEARVISFSIVFGSIKKAINTLNQLVAPQRPTSNPRCHHLFAVIFYQIIELLESGSATFIQGSEGDAESAELITFDQMEILLSDFMFGGVPVDSREQRSLRARLVLRELQQVREIHRRILEIVRVNTPNASEMECHRDLRNRVQKLIEDVKRCGV